MEALKNISIGIAGISSVQITPELVPSSPTDTPGIIQVVIQLVIGIVTLLGLLKKKQQ